MYTGSMNVLYLLLRMNAQVYFRSLGGGFERITTIDRRSNPDSEYTSAVNTPLGVYVERRNFHPKLILWHMIEDIDFEGEIPDYGVQPASGATAPNVARGAGVANIVKK